MSRGANTLDTAFIKQFEAEVHHQWGNMGSQFRGLVREKPVTGLTVEFQKIGKTKMQERVSGNGSVPRQNIAHTKVNFDMEDFYCAVPVNRLDELKVNMNVRDEYVVEVARAVASKYDDLIIKTLVKGGKHGMGSKSQALDKASALKIREWFSKVKAPKEDRFVSVGSQAWSALMQIEEFTNSNYTGDSNLPYADGRTSRQWLGINWMENSELDDYSELMSNKSPILAWQKSAVGLGVNAEFPAFVQWNTDTLCYEIVAELSAGVGIIDTTGTSAMNLA